MEVRLQPLARNKVAALGEPGAAWLASLPKAMDALASRWELTWERSLPGGSASYVVAARTAAGEPRVVKLGMPDPTLDLAAEAAVLAAAAGHGYALLHGHAEDHDALLLERLGSSLEQTPRPPERTLDAVVDVLREAWQVPLDLPSHPRAGELRDLVVRVDDTLRVLDPAVRRQVEEYAEQLAEPGPDGEVVAHGDPHPANVLACERTRGHVLVDPDGIRCDPALDLGVLLREWNPRVLEHGRALLELWCDRVAERSGVDHGRIWRWAFLERVSTGCYVTGFGAERVGAPFLRTAQLLVEPNRRPTSAS